MPGDEFGIGCSLCQLKKIDFLPVFLNALYLTFYQFAVFCRKKPGRRVPFTCIGIGVDNLDAIVLEDPGEGEICSEIGCFHGCQREL
jgi:hypothetical protein